MIIKKLTRTLLVLVLGILFSQSYADVLEPTQSSPLHFNSSERNKAAGYPFSDSVEVDGWVFLSGKLGALPGTSTLAKGGIQGETKQAMENIKASLSSVGLGMDRIVKCLVMIDDMQDWPAFNEVYKQYFPSGNYPARSAFGAQSLALGAKVEIECMARR